MPRDVRRRPVYAPRVVPQEEARPSSAEQDKADLREIKREYEARQEAKIEAAAQDAMNANRARETSRRLHGTPRYRSRYYSPPEGAPPDAIDPSSLRGGEAIEHYQNRAVRAKPVARQNSSYERVTNPKAANSPDVPWSPGGRRQGTGAGRKFR